MIGRITGKCPYCGGDSYLRTSHFRKKGTWRCLTCRRIWMNYPVKKPKTYPIIKLFKRCSQCEENLLVEKLPNIQKRIPFCSTHGLEVQWMDEELLKKKSKKYLLDESYPQNDKHYITVEESGSYNNYESGLEDAFLEMNKRILWAIQVYEREIDDVVVSLENSLSTPYIDFLWEEILHYYKSIQILEIGLEDENEEH